MADPHPATEMYFNQACPVCGRTLQVRVQLLGRRVYCQHCGGGFVARDASMHGGSAVLDRADDLIARASMLLEQASCGDDDAAFSG